MRRRERLEIYIGQMILWKYLLFSERSKLGCFQNLVKDLCEEDLEIVKQMKKNHLAKYHMLLPSFYV